MNIGNRIKSLLLVVGDLVALYAGLFLTLVIRYGNDFVKQFEDAHAFPFTIIFIIWILIFYIAGLYDLRRLRNNLDFLKTLFATLFVNAVIAAMLFYLVPAFGIAPKTNLLIFIALFAVIELVWRRLINHTISQGEAPNKVIIVGDGPVTAEAVRAIRANPQLGYEIKKEIDEKTAAASPEILKTEATRENANLIVVARSLKHEPHLVTTLYELFGQGISIIDLATFYELVLRKVPLADLEETWFLENIAAGGRFYDPLKRASEFLGALLLGIILSPFELIIAVVIKITSPGPVIYRQIRIGIKGQPFTLFKFRTMPVDAERHGPQWAAEGDRRATPFGRFLRKTHLDELPQLWNIVKGDISFVGPRPERPEFVTPLMEKIPYYEIRLLVKPGVTGWAQIHYHKDVTTEDVTEKLQYDIYYLKNRSVILDWAIIVKTLKSIFVSPE